VDAVTQLQEHLVGIVEGSEPASELITLAAARSLAEVQGECEQVWWDAGELQSLAEFVGKLKLHDSGNEAARLFPWQLHVLGALLCRRWRSDDLPATRILVLEIGKGNSKSTMAAMASLYLMATTQSRIEIWALATKRDQADRIVQNAKNFAAAADLVEPAGVLREKYMKLENSDTRSVLGSIATQARTADGLLGALYICDETGRMAPSDDTLGKLAIATAKPGSGRCSVLAMTTPGSDRSNSYYQRRDQIERELRDGTLAKESVGMLYGIDIDDDPFGGPDVWVKGNPMLGHGVIKARNIEALAREAQMSTHGMAEFTREICCRFSDIDAAALPIDMFDECQRDFDPIEKSQGLRVSVGLDLSKRHDLSAATFAVLDNQGHTWIWNHAWTCEYELEQRARSGRMPFIEWAEQGHLTITPGDTIDLGEIERHIRRWMDLVPIWKVWVDPVSGSADTLAEWKQRGMPIVSHKQNVFMMSPPLQKFATLVRSIRREDVAHLYHDGSPVLRECLKNVRISTDYADNPVAEKHRAAGRIDQFISACMAMTGIMEQIREPKSAYDSSSAI